MSLFDHQAHDTRVLLLRMPWGLIDAPSLALGTLKAILARDGMACDVYELNVLFARQIGPNLYNLISSAGSTKFPGESFFTPHYFDLDPASFAQDHLRPHFSGLYGYLQESWGGLPGLSENQLLKRCEALLVSEAPKFIERCKEEIDWSRYDIIGFSLLFAQTLSSLCLARWIKDRYPKKKVVFGGPSCDGEMGYEMLRSFSPIDVVVMGEADLTVSRLMQALRSGGALDEIPGIVFRRDGQIVRTPSPPVLTDLDGLPVPDFSDYFAGKGLGPGGPLQRAVYFETSRGCWWGQKSLCSFCGLNAKGLEFRRKSPDRALQEILGLAAMYGTKKLLAADTIIDMSYLQTLLPRLKEVNAQRPVGEHLEIFYEIKSNIKKEQMRLLMDSGICEVLPGIESFSDGILERMKKGATGIQQMQFVKWATELGLKSVYGILHSNPNDLAEDYREMEAQIDFVDHMIPPAYVTPIILDRFSAYWNHPEQHGIFRIRADRSYQISFPDPAIDHDRLAYRFEYDHADQQDSVLAAAMSSCLERIRRWRDLYAPDRLIYEDLPGEVVIVDHRSGQPEVGRLKGPEADVFLFCDHYTTLSLVAQKFPALSAAGIEMLLDFLVAKKWIYKDRKGRYLSLPTRRSLRAVLGETAAAEILCTPPLLDRICVGTAPKEASQ